MLYNNDQIQDMITKVKNDPNLRKKVIQNIPEWDKRHVQDVLDDGWYERFDRYDSAVCDEFIRAYEKCMKKSVKEYNMKDYELEFEFNVCFTKRLESEEFKSILEYLNSYFGSANAVSGDLVGLNTCSGVTGHNVIEVSDVNWDQQTIYILLYYMFKGHIDWDKDGLDRSFYAFEGAPDSEESFVRSLKSVICSDPDVDLKPEDVIVEWEGSTLAQKLDDIVEYEAIGEYEAKVRNAVKSILEGSEIRKILTN